VPGINASGQAGDTLILDIDPVPAIVLLLPGLAGRASRPGPSLALFV
jgi:hypothetical protein